MSRRDTILTADDLGEEIVDVPGWGVKILIRGMDGIQRSKIQRLATSQSNTANAEILILVARDPDSGNLIFDKADRDHLSGKSGAVVEEVVLAAIRMSGSTPEEAEAQVDEDPTSAGAERKVRLCA